MPEAASDATLNDLVKEVKGLAELVEPILEVRQFCREHEKHEK
jgi:hypothetical protein